MKKILNILILIIVSNFLIYQSITYSQTPSKLDALESAYRAGILTEQEYNAKKAELEATKAIVNNNDGLVKYSDPQNRFTLNYPQGWKINDLGDEKGVEFVDNQKYIRIIIISEIVPIQDVFTSIIQQTRSQWKNFQNLGSGQVNISGKSYPSMECKGINESNIGTQAKLAVYSTDKSMFLFMLITPEAQFKNTISIWDKVLASFELPNPKKEGNTFTHPLGFSFWYPLNWNIQETDSAIQLIPPDVKSNEFGLAEFYLVSTEMVQDISRPDDPQIIQYFESQLTSLLPFLKRTGEAEKTDIGANQGVLITFDGQNELKKMIRSYIFLALNKDQSVTLIGMGEKEYIDVRKAILKEIFSTLSFIQPKITSSLIGLWKHEEFYSSGTFYANTTTYMNLKSDGTFTYGSHAMASMTHQDSSGNMIGNTSADTGSSSPDEYGKWSSDSNKLRLMYADGSYAEYSYYIDGVQGSRNILLKSDNGKNKLWQETK